MKELDTYIVEKLKLNKDTKDENLINDSFVDEIVELCGIVIKKRDGLWQAIKDLLYEFNITEENIEIYCNNTLNLSNRYKEINFDFKHNKYVSKIFFGYMTKKLPTGITLKFDPFIITKIYNGFIILYQEKNYGDYKIYITKK